MPSNTSGPPTNSTARANENAPRLQQRSVAVVPPPPMMPRTSSLRNLALRFEQLASTAAPGSARRREGGGGGTAGGGFLMPKVSKQQFGNGVVPPPTAASGLEGASAKNNNSRRVGRDEMHTSTITFRSGGDSCVAGEAVGSSGAGGGVSAMAATKRNSVAHAGGDITPRFSTSQETNDTTPPSSKTTSSSQFLPPQTTQKLSQPHTQEGRTGNEQQVPGGNIGGNIIANKDYLLEVHRKLNGLFFYYMTVKSNSSSTDNDNSFLAFNLPILLANKIILEK